MDLEGDKPATKLKLQHKKVIKPYYSLQETVFTAGHTLRCSGSLWNICRGLFMLLHNKSEFAVWLEQPGFVPRELHAGGIR